LSPSELSKGEVRLTEADRQSVPQTWSGDSERYGYELPTNLQNFMQQDLTEVNIFQKMFVNVDVGDSVLCVDTVTGSTNLMDGLDDLPPGIGQYDDFHTIDWLRDISRDRMRHRHIVRRRQEGCFEKLKGAHDAWSGWVCVLLVGCAAGLYA